MLIAIVIAKEIFDTKIPRIHRIPNDFMSKWNSTIWAIWLGDWLSSAFGIWDSILGIKGSWTSKFEGPLWALCPQCPLHSAHSGPSNFEVQLPLMPKIKSQIPSLSWQWCWYDDDDKCSIGFALAAGRLQVVIIIISPRCRLHCTTQQICQMSPIYYKS